MRHATRVISLVKSASDGGHVMFAGGIDPDTRYRRYRSGTSLLMHAHFLPKEGLQLPPTARWLALLPVSGPIFGGYSGLFRAYANERSSFTTAPSDRGHPYYRRPRIRWRHFRVRPGRSQRPRSDRLSQVGIGFRHGTARYRQGRLSNVFRAKSRRLKELGL